MSDMPNDSSGDAPETEETGGTLPRAVFISMLLDQDKNVPVVAYKDARPELKQHMDEFLALLDQAHHVSPEELSFQQAFSGHYQRLVELRNGDNERPMTEEEKKVAEDMERAFNSAKDIFMERNEFRESLMNSYGASAAQCLIAESGMLDAVALNTRRPPPIEEMIALDAAGKDTFPEKTGEERYESLPDPVGLLYGRLRALQETSAWLGMKEEVDRRFREDYIPAAKLSGNEAYAKAVEEGHAFVMESDGALNTMRAKFVAESDGFAQFIGHRPEASQERKPPNLRSSP